MVRGNEKDKESKSECFQQFVKIYQTICLVLFRNFNNFLLR